MKCAIVWDGRASGAAAKDQLAFASAVRSLNIEPDTPDVRLFIPGEGWNVIIIPAHSANLLSRGAIQRVVRFVRNGGGLITDSRSTLTDSLGFEYSDSLFAVRSVVDLRNPDIPINWPDVRVARLRTGPGDKILYRDTSNALPLALSRKLDAGSILLFAALFDPDAGEGYSRYPFFWEYVASTFAVGPVRRGRNLDLFVDPGLHSPQPVDREIPRWAAAGIRAVHVAAWYYRSSWPFDYARFIGLCHAHGIRVYAWLEPPHVSDLLYQEHPEWREVNAAGNQVRTSWRMPLALTDSACLETVLREYGTLLQSYAWDGVNLAELYFESHAGFDDSSTLMPMHPSARTAFLEESGFDPAWIFDSGPGDQRNRDSTIVRQFELFRVRTIVGLHRRFLTLFEDVERTRAPLDVIVTTLDQLGHPEFREQAGIDIMEIANLRKEFRFTLQIEDPEREWSSPPVRYTVLAGRYRRALGPGAPLMIDINVMESARRSGSSVTQRPVGTELFQLIRAAASGSSGITLYAASTIRQTDLRFAAFAAFDTSSAR
jgi:hypothetical protein